MARASDNILDVFLRPAADRKILIGRLIRDAEKRQTSFYPDDGYVAMGRDRPLVSLAWTGRDENTTLARLTSRADKIGLNGWLPPFFDNLLPEGALRELVEREMGHGRTDHFDVLERLGEDLPGAIVVRRPDGSLKPGYRDEPAGREASTPPLRFSLAGIQLKFSMRDRNNRLSVPMRSGEFGDVILKVPHEGHPQLPEAEHAAMTMVRAAGLRVANTRLVAISTIDGIPSRFLEHGEVCLAVDRFDRAADSRRVQMEDFAQIVGALGDQTYTMANEESVWNITTRFAGDHHGELLEAVGRSVCNIMLGNGDAHLKNWSFLYREGDVVALSPTYDVVPTLAYGDGELALPFMKTRDPSHVTLHRFERAAGLVDIPQAALIEQVERTVALAFEHWPAILRDLMPERIALLVERRINELPFIQQIRPGAVFEMSRDTGFHP